MVDPMGALITELRNAGIASGRVRGGEPANDDALGPGEYQRFVVLTRLGGPREHRVPVQNLKIGVRAYGSTKQDAAALFGAISDALDNAGPRLTGSGIGIYQTLDDDGGTADKDPDTGQPFEVGVFTLIAATQVVAP